MPLFAPLSPPPPAWRTARVVDFFERLTPASVSGLAGLYAANAYFRDPFNEVRGIAAIQHIFADMFGRLADCRFRILEAVADEHGTRLTWDVTFRINRYRLGIVRTIHGASHLKFDATGRTPHAHSERSAADARTTSSTPLPTKSPAIIFITPDRDSAKCARLPRK